MDNIPAYMLVQGDVILNKWDHSRHIIEKVDFVGDNIYLTVVSGNFRYPMELARSDRINIATYEV